MRGLIGVLGGMGPMATVDFFRKIVEETSAECDQDHVPVIVSSVPDIPSRVAALMQGGASPLPKMRDAIVRLCSAEIECLVIPCNTAHLWYDELCAASALPILHIVDAVREQLLRRPVLPKRIGLLATEATVRMRLYEQRLAGLNIDFIANTAEERAMYVSPAIDLVKRGDPVRAGQLLSCALHMLERRGADTCILACTELPLALEAIDSPRLDGCIDATRSLARSAVAWSRQRTQCLMLAPELAASNT